MMPTHHLPSLTEAVAEAIARRHRTEAVPLQRAVDAVVDALTWLRHQGVKYEALTAALARHEVEMTPATLRSLLRRSTQRRDSGRPMPEPLVTLAGASPSLPPVRAAPAAAVPSSRPAASAAKDHAAQSAA